MTQEITERITINPEICHGKALLQLTKRLRYFPEPAFPNG